MRRALRELQSELHPGDDQVRSSALSKKSLRDVACLTSPPVFLPFPRSKLAQDNRMESPIPILPLSTPDLETEKLIKMKDEEVRQVSYTTSWHHGKNILVHLS